MDRPPVHRAGASRYRRPAPEMLEVELYRRLATAALDRPIAAVRLDDRRRARNRDDVGRPAQGPGRPPVHRGAPVGEAPHPRHRVHRRRGPLTRRALRDDRGTVGGRPGRPRPAPPLGRPLHSAVGAGAGPFRRRRHARSPRPPAVRPSFPRPRRGPPRPRRRRAHRGRSGATRWLPRRPAAGPPLKARLLDQSRLAGVGNLLADEILWRASLSPLVPSASLSESEVRRLHRHLCATLEELAARGG